MSETNGRSSVAYETLAASLGVKRGRDSVHDFHLRLEELAAKEWKVRVTVAREIVTTRWARRTFENLVRHVGLARDEGEGIRAFRERCEDVIGKRWGYARISMRALFGLYRRPSYEKCPKFYEDLAEFGRAEFDDHGRVVKGSLGKGPTVRQFLHVTPAGKDKIKSARAA